MRNPCKQGLDLLLGKWDKVRGVVRDDPYPDFSLPQKIKILSNLALENFEQEKYFFKQNTIDTHISDCLRDLSSKNLEPEELQLESEMILKAIETQHGLLVERGKGIFSFSYLVFQQYLTARAIVTNDNQEALESSLANLVKHNGDRHWREVFLLTTVMLRRADPLVKLMKQEIDQLIAEDSSLQDFLKWGSQKSQPILNQSRLGFNPDQIRILEKYYGANQLLMDCLSSNGEVTPAIRAEIEATMLLSPKDLEAWTGQKNE